ncbi:MarR family winged helix-turn-helix transcriptional regulator [Luteimicrobium subarcticum]|uniref:MarR family transcriptional regulator n=1 Tax=Luteimicrobium subarcticum TaxID=620910 RepID=A0A2M8WVS2_9MICO|nr:MarR family transcriptional regulator [Luteimicrobium subarcticum]PJI95020.1 MarR family transcriptional regulator [Luteimicrobium subarcticum]
MDPARLPRAELRWLDVDEQVAWRRYLVGSQRLTEALAREHERRLALSLPEYEVMVRLSEAPGRSLRMSELADGLAHSRSRVTHTVRRMEEAGWVRREAEQADRRGVRCTMTDEGWATLVAAAPVHVELVRRYLVDPVGHDDLLALGEVMTRVAEACRATAPDVGSDLLPDDDVTPATS